jgi:lipid-A-disaccharide synthase-like uncharacterized protein
MPPTSDTLEFYWKVVGLFGQSLFALRFLMQWYQSEKSGRSVIPLSFWYISLLAGWILLLYSLYHRDPVFIIGFVINFLIYLRNLELIYRVCLPAQRLRLRLAVAALLAGAIVYAILGPKSESPHLEVELGWLIWGFAGQACFNLRFLLQWAYSEARKQSIIPPVFWYLSLIGSLVLLSYAIYQKDVVFTLGQAFGFIVYIRNIKLMKQPG